MAFTRRKLATQRALSDQELIEGFIAGRYSRADLDKRNPFYIHAMRRSDTKIGALAAAAWAARGAKLLKRHGDKLPCGAAFMLHWHGQPQTVH